jgi:hypothetical protein
MAFDLSCAFDTVAKDRLLTKLQAMGINGTELAWFDSYMTGGLQAVMWDGIRFMFVGVRFGVRQGSILGLLLYLCHIADLPDCLGLGEKGNWGNADDTGVWIVHDDPAVVEMELQVLADMFSAFTKGNGLLLIGAKTQLLLSSNVKKQVADSFEILMDGNIVKPADNLELLGVKFDRQFTVRPHKKKLVKDARFRATHIARLAKHLLRGPLLRLLGCGLLLGKLSHALPAVAAQRLPGSTETASILSAKLQVSINDVARSVVGTKRMDHIRVGELLQRAQLPSYNQMAVKAIAMETWNAAISKDGPNGSRNIVGKLIYNC